jgi:hypothetical protein
MWLGCLEGGCCFTGGDVRGVLLNDLGHLDRGAHLACGQSLLERPGDVPL